ncbi:MAG: YhcB family protein [Halothiobacillaceae bacterium]
MADPVVWIVAILVVVVAAVVGYFVGRGNPDRQRVDTLEKQLAAQSAEMTRQQHELDRYQREVRGHFDRTAELFVDMAGSYRALYEHLSKGYDTLGAGPGQRVLPDRPGALLEDPGPRTEPEPTLEPLPDAPASDELASGSRLPESEETRSGEDAAAVSKTDDESARDAGQGDEAGSAAPPKGAGRRPG